MSKEQKKHKKRANPRNYSTLQQHTQTGKTLIPPLLKIPKLQLRSWRDDRLPEMLWAVLLIGNLRREHALDIFRGVINYISTIEQPAILSDVTHSALSKISVEHLKSFIGKLISRPEQKSILKSLLLFESLPAYSVWNELLREGDESIDHTPLMNGVAKTLDHQSQEATDCRWVRVAAMMAGDMFKLPSEEMAKEFAYYPDYGDMRKVRPSIRSTEGMLDSFEEPNREWSEKFWKECWQKTNCFPLKLGIDNSLPKSGTTNEQITIVYNELIKHFIGTNISTAIDVRHDIIFGISFYSLSILRELLRIGISQSIIAKTGLRTLLECYVTLSYLVKKDNDELWKSYRVFGSGQAKLTFLKLENDPERPSSIDIETLNNLANEDVWQEFLPINLGHWENSNLRKLSTEAEVKDEYDRYYAWTSSFVHGHWGAIRETTYVICGNPLHRLHRIPIEFAKPLLDVVSDSCKLVDKIITILAKYYPDFSHRVLIKQDIKE